MVWLFARLDLLYSNVFKVLLNVRNSINSHFFRVQHVLLEQNAPKQTYNVSLQNLSP